ncbi:hypothetical protein HYFRA_00003520 [Hymenoscyphus fraxineus]|uniref:Uncharacterized protein n=1 Tax=Hymenoscyphus fraxineus TaxID=746836 RepID=A0A9N9KUV5_9HELO|nr:hypothetical protein HYFRA_00003520 [Hymenoscyphus fraxineus]
MPPKQFSVARSGGPRRGHQQGYFGAAYSAITSKDNRSVVQSIGIFGVSSHYPSTWIADVGVRRCKDDNGTADLWKGGGLYNDFSIRCDDAGLGGCMI